MPWFQSSNQPRAVECFFCLSPSLLPAPSSASSSSGSSWSNLSLRDRKGKRRSTEVGTEWNWRCERCGCWNIRDETGEMVSVLPGMHNPRLNSESYSLRAKPSTSHLPSTSTSASAFCRSCLSNQSLITNMLANYLPDEDDPSYGRLCEDLPDYVASLHERYPPVCHDCQPAVDAALRKADQKAQSEAWGSALRRGATSISTNPSRSRHVGWAEVLVWRMRGLLWSIGIAVTFWQGVFALIVPEFLLHTGQTAYGKWWTKFLLGFHCCSILWIAWDPYWLGSRRKSKPRPASARRVWVRNNLGILCLRLFSTTTLLYSTAEGVDWRQRRVNPWSVTFMLEALHHFNSIYNQRSSPGVTLRLVRPTSPIKGSNDHAQAISSTFDGQNPTHPALDSLSLTDEPHTAKRTNPIFGQPSLAHTSYHESSGDGVEMMDWEPTPSPSTLPNGIRNDEDDSGADWDRFATGKQRMFPRSGPSQETGLEHLLASWGLGAGSTATAAKPSSNTTNYRASRVSASSASAFDQSPLGERLSVLIFTSAFVITLCRLSMVITNIYFRISGSSVRSFQPDDQSWRLLDVGMIKAELALVTAKMSLQLVRITNGGASPSAIAAMTAISCGMIYNSLRTHDWFVVGPVETGGVSAMCISLGVNLMLLYA